MKTAVKSDECKSHNWERTNEVALSMPPQRVYRCANCGGVRYRKLLNSIDAPPASDIG